MPAKPKDLEAIAQVLGAQPHDAIMLLPRDGQLWLEGMRPTSGLVNRALDRMPKPGGHVPQLPPPPPEAAWLALTADRLVVLTAKSEFIKWVPTGVWAAFSFDQVAGLRTADAAMGFRQVHLTLTDGNHWEFTITRADRKRYAEFEAAVLAATGRGPRY